MTPAAPERGRPRRWEGDDREPDCGQQGDDAHPALPAGSALALRLAGEPARSGNRPIDRVPQGPVATDRADPRLHPEYALVYFEHSLSSFHSF